MTDPDFRQPIELNAQGLRNLAEAGASFRGPRGDRFFFVQEGPPGKGELKPQHGHPDQPAPDGTIIQLDTAAQQPDRPKVTNVSIEAEGQVFPLNQFDAVFWTEAAVEKFVFPYYASKSLWSAAFLLAELSREWYGFIPGQEPQGRGEDPIPFAVAHIPDSDFETLPTEPGHDLHLLFSDGSAKSLAQVLAERKAEGR